MDVAITVGVSLVLSLAAIAWAATHNRPFDAVARLSDREWWVRQFGG
jgi:hypothetical protein